MGRLTGRNDAGRLVGMGRWGIRPSARCILLCVLVSILLIQALPQVDLLDTAFHRDTAPVVIHSQATAAPAWITVSSGLTSFDAPQCRQCGGLHAPDRVQNSPDFIPILDHALRC
jgi:hypothetical protein